MNINNIMTVNDIDIERKRRNIIKEEYRKERAINNSIKVKEDLNKGYEDLYDSFYNEFIKIVKTYTNLSSSKRLENDIKKDEFVKNEDNENKFDLIKLYSKIRFMNDKEVIEFKKNIISYMKRDKYEPLNKFKPDYLGLLSYTDRAYSKICLNYYYKGMEAKRKKNIDLAITYFESVVRLKFSAPASYSELLKIYKNDKNNKIRILNEVISNTNPKNVCNYYNFHNELYITKKDGLENLSISEVINLFEDDPFYSNYLLKYANKYLSKNKKDLDKLNKLTPLLNKVYENLNKAFDNKNKDKNLAKYFKLKGEILLANNYKYKALNSFKESLLLKDNKSLKKKYNKLLNEQ